MGQERQPLVSVCMPAYNVERTLEPALQSVLDQTYRNIEIILLDDGSTDNTQAVAQSFTDCRVRYVRNKTNQGGYQTMNRAVTLAQGDFVAIYHSDDIYEPNIIEKEVGFLRTHSDVGAVFCLDHYMSAEGEIRGGMSMPASFKGRETLRYEDIFPFLLRNKNILFCCPTFMARRSTLDMVGPFDAERYDIAADLDMWIRIARRCPIAILDERLMRYRCGKSQWSSRYNYLRTEEELCFAIMDYYLQRDCWLHNLHPDDLTEYAFHRCDDETFRAANLVIRGDTARARELLHRPYPWRTLLVGIRRRKLRVLSLRAVLRAGLCVGAVNPLSRLVARTEYKGQL